MTKVIIPAGRTPTAVSLWGSLLAVFVRSVSLLLTLAVLAGVALLGHYYDWKLPGPGLVRNADQAEDAEPVKPAAEQQDSTNLAPVKLESAQTAERAGFRFARVGRRTMNQVVPAFGVLGYDQTRFAHLSTRVQGTVWRVEKGLGDRVRKGDVLAVIEAAEVGKAKAEFLQSVVQVNVRQINLAQLRGATGAMPEKTIRDAETSLREARIKLLNDQQALVNLGLPARLDDLTGLSDDKMVRAVRLLGLTPALVHGQDPDTLTANLLPLRAPFDGEVISHDIVIGEIATTTTPQFVLADVRRLWVILEIRREDAARLAVGQEVAFLPDGAREDATAEPCLALSTLGLLSGEQGSLLAALSALPNRDEMARGRLSWISLEVDEKTRTVKARAEVSNPQRRLRPHTFGNGRILVRRQSDAIAVPTEAIQTDGPNQLVFVKISEQEFQPRLVQTGVRDENFTEILSGVLPDEIVVATGSHVLKTELFKDRLGE
jgi:membrane fusion protein, heavy metal efflux system